ncbi:spore germination protein [Halobacillus yeomjeoni]|uniref:Spore germination protein n=1 Tax=Halobacillus yeomjeoni TaxID=311194 RepID=A0A931HS00_9BACI|nr:spore germination protein [Halobacillus yeomjeoni]MBH0228622.1 spore germination protein [Halobacillus yeomjeoni]
MGFLKRFLFGDHKRLQDRQLNDHSEDIDYPSSTKLEDNVNYLLDEFHNSSDVKVRIMQKGNSALMYFESLVDKGKLYDSVFTPLEEGKIDSIGDIPIAKMTYNLEEAIDSMLRGHAIYMEDGSRKISQFAVTASFNRSVEEPINERIVRGAHSGFVENLLININLIRKRIEHRDLTVKYYKLGKYTDTNVALIYVDGIADPTLVAEVDRRILSVSTDMVHSPGYVGEIIEDNTFSPFPQMLNTERPDRLVGNLMEGRVAIMSEGSPTSLIAPSTFFMFYQAPDDYNMRWWAGTFVRLIRLTSFIIAVGLPAFYIAIVSFHFEVIPDDLILQVKGSINDIAYPPILEALVMVVIIELIREAGIRLPQPIGQTIGIVGGLVIGDAVVRAGLVSNLMIIVVALTAIASFVVPSNEFSTILRLLTFPLIILAGTLGFIGIIFGFLMILIHLTKLESFGTPYLAPVAPLTFKDLKDTFIRVPIFNMKERPKDSQAIKKMAQGESREWKQNEQPAQASKPPKTGDLGGASRSGGSESDQSSE